MGDSKESLRGISVASMDKPEDLAFPLSGSLKLMTLSFWGWSLRIVVDTIFQSVIAGGGEKPFLLKDRGHSHSLANKQTAG